MSASNGEKADPPGYDAATRSAHTSVYPKFICSTSGPDGLEAYAEVDRVLRGTWGTQRASLVTLVITHVSPHDVRSSTTTLTISAAPGPGMIAASTSTLPSAAEASAPQLMLHAPAYLRRPIVSSAAAAAARPTYASFGVFAPAPQAGQDQRVVVKLDDPLGGISDRVRVCLVIVHHDAPFTIKGSIRLRPMEPAGDTASLECAEEGGGVVVGPSDGPMSGWCSLCRKTMNKDGSINSCSGLDRKHIDTDVWAFLVGGNLPGVKKWDTKENLGVEATWSYDCSSLH